MCAGPWVAAAWAGRCRGQGAGEGKSKLAWTLKLRHLPSALMSLLDVCTPSPIIHRGKGPQSPAEALCVGICWDKCETWSNPPEVQ